MAGPIITKRVVYCIGGYDPMSPETVYRRFVRELQRFRGTWSVAASVSEPEVDADLVTWTVATTGPNWKVETRYHVVRWDDVMDTIGSQPIWQRIALGLLALFDFIAGGALWGYLRTSWRYAIFFLYPLVLFAGFALAAWSIHFLVSTASGSALIGAAAGLAAFALLLWGLGRRLFLFQLFDGWIFSSAYVRRNDPVLTRRFERIAQEIEIAARGADVGEVLVVGHSLGSALAVDLLDGTLKRDPDLGTGGARVSFLSIGSSILKIGLHRRAVRFRAAVARVAAAPGLFWAEYQTLPDVMNFYKINPVTALGLKATDRPVIRIIWFKKMLDAATYRRLHRNFFRIHNQFVSGSDRRAEYDYFMLVCGPLSVERNIGLPEGVKSAVAEDGSVREELAHDGTERARRLVRQ